MIRRVVLCGALSLTPLAAVADPLPVHTPTQRVGRHPSREQRIQLANAVADVLNSTQSEVLSGQETSDRLQTLQPTALSCDVPACIGDVASPMHARAVALVRQDFVASGSFRVSIDVVTPHGEVTAHAEAEEPVGAWTESVALARVVAARVATALRAPPPAPVAVTPSPVHPPRVEEGRHPTPAPQPPVPTYHRRIWEAGAGGGLVLVGVVATVAAAVAIGQDGSDVAGQTYSPAMHTVYTAGAGSYVLLSLGVPAILGGAYLVFDGLRQHRDEQPAVAFNPLRVGVATLPHGTALTLDGAF